MAMFWRQPSVGRADGRKRRKPEDARQTAIKHWLTLKHYPYWDTSQPFRALVTPGLPDLLAFVPHLVFIEVKSQTGRQTKAQEHFQAACEAAGIPYILARSVGDVIAAVEGE